MFMFFSVFFNILFKLFSFKQKYRIKICFTAPPFEGISRNSLQTYWTQPKLTFEIFHKNKKKMTKNIFSNHSLYGKYPRIRL